MSAAAGTIAFAVALCGARPAALSALGAALLTPGDSCCLPWRLPRLHRTGSSFWAESLCGVLGPAVALAVLAAMPGPGLLAPGTAWYRYLVAARPGCRADRLGGSGPVAATGQLSFAVGPTPRAQGLARAFCAMVAVCWRGGTVSGSRP